MFKLKDLLSKKIVKEIKEVSGLGSALGGKSTAVRKPGYKSTGTSTARSDYDTKSTDHDTKVTAYDRAVTAKDDSKRYRKAGKKGTYTYSATSSKGYSTNPDWTAWNTDILGTGSAKNTASTAKDSAKTKWDSSIESDRQATIGITPPATTGGMKGKATGKGGGKKGKKKY